MHTESLVLMAQQLDRLPKLSMIGKKVLDVGSVNINGSYRELVESLGATYTGLDVQSGDNVDIIADDPYRYPLPRESFDAVLCGNALHNMEAFWLVIPEMVRVLKPGGLIAVVAVTWNKSKAGKWPIDAWRFMEDGLRYLFDMTGKLRDYEFTELETDIAGSAIKR